MAKRKASQRRQRSRLTVVPLATSPPPSIWSKLAPEILLDILKIACKASTQACASLCRVSKWTKAFAGSMLYEDITLATWSSAILLSRITKYPKISSPLEQTKRLTLLMCDSDIDAPVVSRARRDGDIALFRILVRAAGYLDHLTIRLAQLAAVAMIGTWHHQNPPSSLTVLPHNVKEEVVDEDLRQLLQQSSMPPDPIRLSGLSTVTHVYFSSEQTLRQLPIIFQTFLNATHLGWSLPHDRDLAQRWRAAWQTVIPSKVEYIALNIVEENRAAHFRAKLEWAAHISRVWPTVADRCVLWVDAGELRRSCNEQNIWSILVPSRASEESN